MTRLEKPEKPPVPANTIRVFLGYDERERNGFHVCMQSILDQSLYPFISFHPLKGDQRDGTNAFTYARFLIPWLCNYKGWAIFLDGSDMLVRNEIAQLYVMRDSRYAVQVVKHDYKTKHPRKYKGTAMEADNADYPRKNWSSVVLWNCGHISNMGLTPDAIRDLPGSFLHRFEWLKDEEIGELPPDWNVLIGEQEAITRTKIAHYTVGIPHIPAYAGEPFADEYRAVLAGINAPIEAAGAKEN